MTSEKKDLSCILQITTHCLSPAHAPLYRVSRIGNVGISKHVGEYKKKTFLTISLRHTCSGGYRFGKFEGIKPLVYFDDTL